MFMQISINTITRFACLSLAVLSLNSQAQGAPAPGSETTTTTTTHTTETKGGPVRKLHKKVRNMRPRIKMRKAVVKKITGGDKKPATTPTTSTPESSK
jgi:hypothetical protein